MTDADPASLATSNVGAPPASPTAHNPCAPVTRMRPSGCQSAHKILQSFSGSRARRVGLASATLAIHSSLNFRNANFDPSEEKNAPLAPLSTTVRSSPLSSERNMSVAPVCRVTAYSRYLASGDTTGADSDPIRFRLASDSERRELVMEMMPESGGPTTANRMVRSDVTVSRVLPPDRTAHVLISANVAITAKAPRLRGSRIHARHPCAPALRASASASVAMRAKCTSCNASLKPFALSKRSAGSFSSAFDTAAATCAGTALRYFVTDSAGAVMIFMMTCCALDPVCGGSPVSISYSTLPIEYTSLRAEISFSAVACSGLM